MKKQYCSPLMASIHETAEGLHASGLLSKRTMREFDELCLTLMQPLTPKEILTLRLGGGQPSGFRRLSQRDNGSSQPVGTR